LIIFTQLAELCSFFIIVVDFHRLLIVGTYKIEQTVSDSIQPLVKPALGLSGCRPRGFTGRNIFQLLRNRYLCVLNSLSCHSGFSLHIMLKPFLFLFIAQKEHFLSSFRGNLL
jgi:hypothetical protein